MMKQSLTAACLILLLASAPTIAQTPPPLTDAQRETEAQDAMRDVLQTGIRGPADVTLQDQGQIHLPAGMVWAPSQPANRLMRAYGNSLSTRLVGIILNPRQSWVATVSFIADGHVSDSDSAELNAEDILTNLREGTAEGNKDRAQRGFPEIELTGWIQPPAYDPPTHRLIWALGVQRKSETDSTTGVNYNTRMLGRDGYFALNMLTDLDHIKQDRPTAIELLSGLTYVQGKRFEDFNASTDHLAEYGLAALIGVVAAKKLGLIAIVGVFLLKFAKIGLIALAGGGALVARFFRRKPNS